MIGKRSKPVIGELTGAAFSSSRRMDGATSPRSPLDLKIQSPRGLKSFDFGGVGLAIIAALEKSGGKNGQTLANKTVYNRNSNRTLPIPVISSAKNSAGFDVTEMDSFEEYTIVTCRPPGNKSYTKVYGDNRSKCENRTEIQGRKCNRPSVFNISPARIGDFPAYPDSNFLSSCHLCQKKLHGKDIYMYRGEKAFCSTECRYRQIVMDDHKDKCSSEVVPRSVDVATSPYGNGQIFATGILAI